MREEEIKSLAGSINSFDDAVEVKYEIQNKLISYWFERKISTTQFLDLLTKMHEEILDKLIKVLINRNICVIGYGKLGVGEINLSSDIDICFVYDSDVDEEENIVKLVRKFINTVTETKGRKFLWRIDLDLRPGGKSSPPAVSDKFFTWYYLNLGTQDDRYALLRAREVAGNKELGRKILKEIEPFVFRKYIDFSALERLREIKIAISKSIRRSEDEKKFDVKFSEGGIREIEFVVFVNQLIFGGKDERLRKTKKTSELLEIIEKEYLRKNAEENSKKNRESEFPISLRDCYIFLREVETLIQLEEERRFTLEEKDLDKILGFFRCSKNEFFEKLSLVRETVSRVFRETFEVELPEYKIITQDISDEEIERYLEELGYKDTKSALSIVKDMLSQTIFLKERKRNIFEIKIEPTISQEKVVSSIVWYCSKSPRKEEALSSFYSFIKSVGKRKGIYVMLSKNEKLTEIISEFMGISKLFTNFLISHPESIDTIFLSTQISPYPPDESEFWERVKDFQVEDVLDEIRRVKKEKILITILEDLSRKYLEFPELSKRICSIYDFVLRETISLTAREKLGISKPPKELDIPFCVIALGKYGSGEAIYGSDADLLFTFSEGEPEDWIKFSQKTIVFLTSRTREGEGLVVDMRLRPSGKAGPLALSKNAMEEFYTKRSDIWQRITLLKSRVVFGGGSEEKENLFREFLQEIKEKSFENVKYEDLKKSLYEMRKKTEEKLGAKDGKLNIKYCKGGMQEIEFITFLFQVKERKILNESFLSALEKASEKFGEALKKGYEILRKIEKFSKLISDVPLEDVFVDENDENFWQKLRETEGIELQDFKNSTQKIREIFIKVFEEEKF